MVGYLLDYFNHLTLKLHTLESCGLGEHWYANDIRDEQEQVWDQLTDDERQLARDYSVSLHD